MPQQWNRGEDSPDDKKYVAAARNGIRKEGVERARAPLNSKHEKYVRLYLRVPASSGSASNRNLVHHRQLHPGAGRPIVFMSKIVENRAVLEEAAPGEHKAIGIERGGNEVEYSWQERSPYRYEVDLTLDPITGKPISPTARARRGFRGTGAGAEAEGNEGNNYKVVIDIYPVWVPRNASVPAWQQAAVDASVDDSTRDGFYVWFGPNSSDIERIQRLIATGEQFSIGPNDDNSVKVRFDESNNKW